MQMAMEEERRIPDLGRPCTVAQAAAVKGTLPRRWSREDPSLSFQNIALPAPWRSYSQGQLLPVPSRSASTTSCSSLCREAEEVNWDEMFTSQPGSLCGSQRSQPSQPLTSPASGRETRWEPHFHSPTLPRPVLSGARPLRRPSSTTSLHLYDDLVAAAEGVQKEAEKARLDALYGTRREIFEPWRSLDRPRPVSELGRPVELASSAPRLRPLSKIFEQLRPETKPQTKLQVKQQERHSEDPKVVEKAAQEEQKDDTRMLAEKDVEEERQMAKVVEKAADAEERQIAKVAEKAADAEVVSVWEFPDVPSPAGATCLQEHVHPATLSPISERTEFGTEKATPTPPRKPGQHGLQPALLTWAPPLPRAATAREQRNPEPCLQCRSSLEEGEQRELPEEMLAPPEEQSEQSEQSEEEERTVQTVAKVTALRAVPRRSEPSRFPQVTTAPSLQGLLRSMEEDQHFTWLAQLGPAPRPLTLEETLQDMAVTIAAVDAQLLSVHPPSQLEASAQLQEAESRAAEASREATELHLPRSPELHQEEEPREQAPAATPKSAEIAGELLRKKVKSSGLLETPDTASVISRNSKKELEDPDSTLSRFLQAKRSPAPSTRGTPRPHDQQKAPHGSRSRVSSEDSNAYSDVSFFGQSSICEPNTARLGANSRGSKAPHAAAATPKTQVECALCGRQKMCQPGSCFCLECSKRMNQIDPASPTSAGESPGVRTKATRAAGPAGPASRACVICGQRFMSNDGSSVLCPSCLGQP